MGARSPVRRRTPPLRVLMLTALLLGCSDAASQPVQLVASSARVPFHLSNCNRVRRIPDDKLVVFEDRKAATAAGHTPCGMCRP